MDAHLELQSLLPWWVRWSGPLALILSCAIASAGLHRLANSLALSGFDRESHWTQRARVGFVAGGLSSLLLFFLPALCASAVLVLHGPLWALSRLDLAIAAGLCSFVGALSAHYRLVRRVHPSAPNPLGFLASGLSILFVVFSFLIVLAFFSAIAPERIISVVGLAWAGGLVLFSYLALRGGGLRLARLVGLARPADERLARIVESAAARSGRSPPRTSVIPWRSANALAFPLGDQLVFSKKIIEVLDDQQLEAITLHELAHLGESRGAKALRLLSALPYLPLAAIPTIFGQFGLFGMVAVVLVAALGALLIRKFERKMEERADDRACSDSDEAAVYASALARIYETNCVPAVMPPRQRHPDLYDRLTAAGSPPEYPRPKPPSMRRVSWLSIGAFAVSVILVIGLRSGTWALLDRVDQGDRGQLMAAIAIAGEPFELGALAELEKDHDTAIRMHRVAVALTGNPHDAFFERARLADRLSEAGRCEEGREVINELLAGPLFHEDEFQAAAMALVFCDTGISAQAPRN